MRLRGRGIGALLLAAALSGVTSSPVAQAEKTPPVCENLAEVFYTIAEYRERGESREAQHEWAREMFAKKRVPAQLLERAVDYVYRSSEDPAQIRTAVREGCVVNSSGQAVVRLPGL
jgi:hypothetical protein